MTDAEKAKIKGLYDVVVALLRQKGYVVETNEVNSYYSGTYNDIDNVDGVGIHLAVDTSSKWDEKGKLIAHIGGRNGMRDVTYKERSDKGINFYGIVARIEELVSSQKERARMEAEQQERYRKQREEQQKVEKVRNAFSEEFGLLYPYQDLSGGPDYFTVKLKYLSSDQLRELLDFAKTCGMLKYQDPESC